MRVPVFLLVLALAALAGWFLAHDEPTTIGPRLEVAGERVPDDEVLRWLIHGPGHQRVETARLRWICEREIELQAERAARIAQRRALVNNPGAARHLADTPDPARVAAEREALRVRTAATDDELEREYGLAVSAYLTRNPERHLEAELARAHRSSAWFRDQLRQELVFDKLFFPELPEDWPDETWSALENVQPSGQNLRRREYRAIQGGMGWRTMREPGAEQGRDRLRQLHAIVRQHVEASIRWWTPADGLPAGQVLAADFDDDDCADRTLSTSDLWSEVREAVEEWEVDEIRRWVATCHAVRARLARAGLAIDEEFRRRVLDAPVDDALAAELDQGFPWPAMQAEYAVLAAAFNEVSFVELSNDAPSVDLADSERRAAWKRGKGRVQVEILLVPALDIARHRWSREGWSRARQRAEQLAREIHDNEQRWNARSHTGLRQAGDGVEPFVYWNRLLDEESGWWDPPEARDGPGTRTPRHHGRFVDVTWAELRKLLGENTYTDFVHGDSIAERVFFGLEQGRVTGPYRCALGWCLVRVGARRAPEADFAEYAQSELLRHDALQSAFASFAAEARAAARIEGLEPER